MCLIGMDGVGTEMDKGVTYLPPALCQTLELPPPRLPLAHGCCGCSGAVPELHKFLSFQKKRAVDIKVLLPQQIKVLLPDRQLEEP